MKLNIELINGVTEFGSGFNALWHGTIMETDAVPICKHASELGRGMDRHNFQLLV